jgi:hypothetical protein
MLGLSTCAKKNLSAEINFLREIVEKNGERTNISSKSRVRNDKIFKLTPNCAQLCRLSNCGSHLAVARKLWRLQAKIRFGEQRDFGHPCLPHTAVCMGDAQKRNIAKL